jgi:hypothetical protein
MDFLKLTQINIELNNYKAISKKVKESIHKTKVIYEKKHKDRQIMISAIYEQDEYFLTCISNEIFLK